MGPEAWEHKCHLRGSGAAAQMGALHSGHVGFFLAQTGVRGVPAKAALTVQGLWGQSNFSQTPKFPGTARRAGVSSPSVVCPGNGQSGDLRGQPHLRGWKDKPKRDKGLG